MHAGTPLTIHVATLIAALLRAVQGNLLVTLLNDDGSVSVGTARAIVGADSAGFLNMGEDLRSGRVWITMRSGFESFIPVPDLLARVENGTVALDFDGGS